MRWLRIFIRNTAAGSLYGPVEIPEYDSEVYGFLAADGDNLEDIWYGIWHEPLENQTFPITKMPLFK